MALSSGGFSLSDVSYELNESTLSDQNDMISMYDYVFGSHTSGDSLQDFGSLGVPAVSSLSTTAGDGHLDLSWNLDDTGGFATEFVAQYWQDDGTNTPPHTETSVDGTASSAGTYTGTISGLNNGSTYYVRVFAWNKFNDQQNFPDPYQDQYHYPVTNTVTDTPEASISRPSILVPDTSHPDASTAQRIYIDISASGAQSDINIELRINGSSTGFSRDCSAGIGTTTPEIIILSQLFFGTSDTVEVRAQETDGTNTSTWSSWTSIPAGATPSCPL